MFIRNARLIIIVTLFTVCLSGCTGIGPQTISRDRFNYTKAISDSWKNQLLLNMVMIRYGDAPVFLDIASIINSYSIETQVDGSLSWSPPGSNSEQQIGGLAKYSDRPTITYNPLMGQKFARSLMTPISTSSILHFIKSGYRIDMVLRLYVHSINKLKNRYGGSLIRKAADPKFYSLIDELHSIQESGAFGMKVEKKDDQVIPIVFFQETHNKEVQADIDSVYTILGLNPDVQEFPLVSRTAPDNDREIALLSRSLLEVLTDLASYIDVPNVHVEETRVKPTFLDKTASGIDVDPIIRIYSSQEKPNDAFVDVYYQNHWFWIDNHDLRSKVIFSYIMFIFTLTETESEIGAPIVTIPAG